MLRAPWGKARAELYQEIASLLRAGVGPREALQRLRTHHRGRTLQLIEPLAVAVERGDTLSSGMASRPARFSPLERALVATGEASGRLDEAFQALSDQAEASHLRNRRLVLALLYPVFLLHAASVLLPIPFYLVQEGFAAYVTVAVSLLLMIWIVLVGGVSLHGACRHREGYAKALLALPFVGKALHAGAVSRFAGALGSLHGAGITSDRALGLAAGASGNGWMRRELGQRAERVRAGEPLGDALLGARSLPSEVVGLIATGEHAGDLEATLAKAARLYGERFEQTTKILPGVLFVLGVLFVGAITLLMALKVIGGIVAQY